MTKAKRFIEQTGKVIGLAQGRVNVMACDNLNNPNLFRGDLINPKENNDCYFASKFKENPETKSVIKYHALLLLSNSILGYNSIHFYYSDPNNIVAVEFDKCTPKFLEITQNLGMVNGTPYKKRIFSNEKDAYIFIF